MAGDWIKLHRSIFDSPDFAQLRPDQWAAAVKMLIFANWKQAYFDGVLVNRGELAFSTYALSEKTRVGVQVIRSTVKKLLGAGALSCRKTNTASGTPIRILTWVNYEKFQAVPEDVSTSTNASLTQGQREPNASLTRGQHQVKKGKNNKKNKKEEDAGAEAPAAVSPKRVLSDMLVREFQTATGHPYVFAGAKDGRAVDSLLKAGDFATVERLWRQSLNMQRYPGTASIAVFASRWNEFIGLQGPPKQQESDYERERLARLEDEKLYATLPRAKNAN